MKHLQSVAAAILVALLPPVADAALIKVVAEGTLSSFTDPDGLLAISEPAPGTRLRMEITYNEESTGFDGGTATLYSNIGTEFWVGDQQIGPFGPGQLVIGDDVVSGSSTRDAILVRSQERFFLDPGCTDSTCPRNVEDYFLSLSDETAQAISSEELFDIPWSPVAWPSLAVLEYEFSFQENASTAEVDLAQVTADIDTLTATVIPLPAPFILFLSALAALRLCPAKGRQRREQSAVDWG